MNKVTKILSGVTIVVIIFVSIFLFFKKSNEIFINKQKHPINSSKKIVAKSVNKAKQNAVTKNSNKIIYKTYINKKFNIELSYPATYEVKEGFMGTVVVFLSQIEGPMDLFRGNLNVMVQKLSINPMTLDEYSAVSLIRIKTFITDPKILLSKKVMLAGKPAYEVIYTGKQGAFDLEWKQIWIVVNKHAYVLTCASEKNKFNDHLNAFNKIFNSFKFLN